MRVGLARVERKRQQSPAGCASPLQITPRQKILAQVQQLFEVDRNLRPLNSMAAGLSGLGGEEKTLTSLTESSFWRSIPETERKGE